MKQIASALVKAQREFGPALKTSRNPHFKSKYADLAAVVEAVIDGLNNNGIALIQQTHECESGVIVETLLIHESGEQISGGRLHVPASKQDAQGYGSALTYARRYSLMATTGIAPEDDDGNAASKREALNPDVIAQIILNTQSMDDLKSCYAKAYKQFQGDQQALAVIEDAKNKRKTELMEIK